MSGATNDDLVAVKLLGKLQHMVGLVRGYANKYGDWLQHNLAKATADFNETHKARLAALGCTSVLDSFEVGGSWKEKLTFSFCEASRGDLSRGLLSVNLRITSLPNHGGRFPTESLFPLEPNLTLKDSVFRSRLAAVMVEFNKFFSLPTRRFLYRMAVKLDPMNELSIFLWKSNTQPMEMTFGAFATLVDKMVGKLKFINAAAVGDLLTAEEISLFEDVYNGVLGYHEQIHDIESRLEQNFLAVLDYVEKELQALVDYQGKCKARAKECEATVASLAFSPTCKATASPVLDSMIADNACLAVLAAWLKKSSVTLELLYRNTRDGATAEAFHRKCDGVPGTVVLAKARNGFVFGGLNTSTWGDVNAATSLSGAKQAPGSFLFVLPSDERPDDAQQFPLKGSDASHVKCHPNEGPTFGAGPDLTINPAKDAKSTSNLGTTYCCASPTTLAGSSSFDVAEFEVFRLK